MKKLLLLTAITCSTISFGQRVIKNTFDDRTQTRYITTNLTARPYFKDLKAINREGGTNVFLQFQSEVSPENTINYLNIELVRGLKKTCIRENAETIIKFENETELVLKNSSAQNCDIICKTINIITEDDLRTLSENKIKSILFYTTEGPMEFRSHKNLKHLSKETAELHLETIKNPAN